MILSIPLLISFRFSCSRYHNNMVSFTFVISTVGIALGVAVLIIGLSAMNGFERELNNRILGIIPHGEIQSVSQPWKNWNSALRRIKKAPGIISVAPYINFSGVMESRKNLVFLQINGIDPQKEEHLNGLSKFVKNSVWMKFKDGDKQIIIGKGVADTLRVKQNDWVLITFPRFYKEGGVKKISHIRLRIVDILNLNGQLSQNLAIIPLEDASQYLRTEGGITGISIKVNNPFDAKKVICNAAKSVNNYVYVKSWTDTYGYIYHDIQMIRSIIYLTMILVMGLACFNITSMLTMAVKERRNDIAILRTLGMKNSFIYIIFMMYGFLSGLTGGLLGIATGTAIALQLTPIFNGIEKLVGNQFLSDKIYFVDFFPSELSWLEVINVSLITIVLSLIASWYPSYYAARVDPAVVLKS